MADGAHRRPAGTVFNNVDGVRTAVSITSLTMLVLGLVGYVLSWHGLSAFGLVLFALFGFGSAVLITLDVRGWRLVALSSPLGLAFILIAGGLMVNLGRVGYGRAAVLAAGGVECDRTHRCGDARGARWLSQSASPRVTIVRIPSLLTSEESLRQFAVAATRSALIELVLIGLGLVMCLISALAVRHLDPGWGGFLAAISPAWYVGLALITSAIFVGQRYGAVLAGLPVIALQLVLTGTPAIVYDLPRYAWTANHVGITSYVMVHGSVNPSIDIYQAWPGLFSGVAWLCKVSNFSSPMGVARWWPPIIDLATLW